MMNLNQRSLPPAVAHLILVRSMPRFCILIALVAFLLIAGPASAYDDAEILARRVPKQSYYVGESFAVLERGEISWLIVLWACDPATLRVVKVLGGSAHAPYAIKITPSGDNPIDALGHVGRLRSIHLLAASLEDAVKMRRALIAEIAAMQRRLEARQGKPPGYLKRVVESKRL
jgi:hypothetical protein